MDLCIVPCGTKKIWDENPNAGPTLAKDVYIGPFAKKVQRIRSKILSFLVVRSIRKIWIFISR